MSRPYRWRLARIALLLAASWSRASAQETTAIVVLPEQSSSLEIGLLEPTAPSHATLRVRPKAFGPLRIVIPAGTVFLADVGATRAGSDQANGGRGQTGGGEGMAVGGVGAAVGGGEQGMMTIATASVAVGGEIPSSIRHAAISAPLIHLVASTNDPAPTENPARMWTDIPIQIMCFEKSKADPTSSTRWRLASSQEVDSRGLVELSREVLLLSNGIAAVDREVAALAANVRAQQRNGVWQLEYDGDPMTQTTAHLFRSADWVAAADGSVAGRLNRSLVVQFAVWALSDGATRSDLAARLADPRFSDLQPRESSLRWSVEHLLNAAGLANRFAGDTMGSPARGEKREP